MPDTLDQDTCALKEWLRSAWRFLADPSSTRFQRRETRNYMKDVNLALRASLKRIADKESARSEAERVVLGASRPDFRILKLMLERSEQISA